MASTTDATYSPRVYREHGGENFIIASSGDLYVQSGGDLIVESGGSVQLDAGSSFLSATHLELSSGYSVVRPYTTRSVAQKATALVLGAINGVCASTTAPTYILPAPVLGATLVVATTGFGAAGSTAILSSSAASATLSVSGADKLTLTARNNIVEFYGLSSTRWIVQKNTTIAFSGP